MTVDELASVRINGELLSPGEVTALRVAVTELHDTMSDPAALGNDDHGRAMVAHYRRNTGRILSLLVGA